jgi:hypothetical protein
VIDFCFHGDWCGLFGGRGREKLGIRKEEGSGVFEGSGKRKEEGREGGKLAWGFNWRGIALSGLPAKVQPHGLFGPGRRCVETSGDVICLGLTKSAEECQHLFFQVKKNL